MFINVNGTWKNITDMFVNVSGTWKRITDGFVNVAGTWKRFFSSALLSIAQQVQIAQSTNATTFLTTLTGTNYYWSPGPPVLTYKFQRSTNGGSTWSDLDSGSITNPAFGSSNTKTYLLPSTGPSVGVLPNVLNYYRFRVDATYGSLTAESISSSTTIQGPTNTTIGLSDPTFASVSLSWTPSTGANRYLVYRSPDNNLFSQYASVPSGTTSIFGISDLTGGNTYYFYVVPVTGGSFANPGYYGNNSNTLVLPILATPTLSSSTSQAGGFSFTINNYDASNTYVISTTSGSISRSGNLVTVSGLSQGSSATATVRATRSGYGNSNSATRTGSALPEYSITWNPNGGTFSNGSSSNEIDTGISGTVTSPSSTPTRSGFTFLYWRDTISGDFTYQVNSGGTWTIGTSGTTNLTFYARWQSNNLITNPAYGASTSTDGGWTASISTQPNPTGGTYSVISTTAGSASVNSSTGALTASGLSVGQSSTVTVRYSLAGYNPVDITASGSALSKLSTPTNVVASDNRTDGVNITWTAVSGAAYYGVWYGPPAPSYNSTPDFGGPSNPSLITGTSYLDTSLGSGVTRDYYVQAFRTNNPAGTKSEWSAGDSGTRVAASSTGATQISYVAPTTAAINVTTGSGTIPDDGFFTLNLPFNTFFNGTSYSQIFIGTNSYATFGGGSGAFSGLSASNPAFNKIMIAAADRGSTGVYFTSSASSWTMRYEGSSGTSGSPIATIWELQCLSSNPKSIRLSIVQVASGGFTGMCSSSSLINSLGGAGTSWNITSA